MYFARTILSSPDKNLFACSFQLPQDPQIEVKNEGTLLSIPRVGFEHAGLYSCQAREATGFNNRAVSAEFKLSVECKQAVS